MVCSTKCSDKKNENKEVAVNEVQPVSTAREAIQYSMSVSSQNKVFPCVYLDSLVSRDYMWINMITYMQGSVRAIHYAEFATVVSCQALATVTMTAWTGAARSANRF